MKYVITNLHFIKYYHFSDINFNIHYMHFHLFINYSTIY